MALIMVIGEDPLLLLNEGRHALLVGVAAGIEGGRVVVVAGWRFILYFEDRFEFFDVNHRVPG